MADDGPVVEEEPTELEILQGISDDIKYLIKSIIPSSVYQDFEYPSDDVESEG